MNHARTPKDRASGWVPEATFVHPFAWVNGTLSTSVCHCPPRHRGGHEAEAGPELRCGRRPTEVHHATVGDTHETCRSGARSAQAARETAYPVTGGEHSASMSRIVTKLEALRIDASASEGVASRARADVVTSTVSVCRSMT